MKHIQNDTNIWYLVNYIWNKINVCKDHFFCTKMVSILSATTCIGNFPLFQSGGNYRYLHMACVNNALDYMFKILCRPLKIVQRKNECWYYRMYLDFDEFYIILWWHCCTDIIRNHFCESVITSSLERQIQVGVIVIRLSSWRTDRNVT